MNNPLGRCGAKVAVVCRSRSCANRNSASSKTPASPSWPKRRTSCPCAVFAKSVATGPFIHFTSMARELTRAGKSSAAAGGGRETAIRTALIERGSPSPPGNSTTRGSSSWHTSRSIAIEARLRSVRALTSSTTALPTVIAAIPKRAKITETPALFNRPSGPLFLLDQTPSKPTSSDRNGSRIETSMRSCGEGLTLGWQKPAHNGAAVADQWPKRPGDHPLLGFLKLDSPSSRTRNLCSLLAHAPFAIAGRQC